MKSKSFKESFIYALKGISYSFASQRNFKIHTLATAIILMLSFIINLAAWEILFIFSAIFLVLVMEMFNTAIEATVDLFTEEYHPLAATAKNVAAGAVLIASVYAIIVGIVIFSRIFFS